jgi:hypothetical protein
MSSKEERRPTRLERHLASRDVARILYGTVIGLALVLALQIHPPDAGETAGAIVATALAVGLAELYSDIVGTEARTRQTLDATQLRALSRAALVVFAGAGFPAVYFALAAAGAIETHTAFTLSKWSGFGLICGYGFLASRMTGAGLWRALLHAAAVGVVGGALIAFKSLLH